MRLEALYAMLAAGLAAAGCAGPDRPAPDPGPAPSTPSTVRAEAVEHAAPDPVPAAPADPRAPSIELAFVGDVMFGRYTATGFAPIRAELHDPFADVRELLRADLTMANLETPVMRAPPARSPWGAIKRFVATPERVASLRAAGIDLVTLANNHAEDMRDDGITETAPLLGELGITAVGAVRTDAPLIRAETVVVRGWRIAFVAATTVRNAPSTGGPLVPYVHADELAGALIPAIAAARPGHDLVIAALHWGDEYRDEPADWQVATAHAAIDAGADAVIGHHPHVLQPIERYRGGVIAYSLGNFVFDHLGPTVRQSGVLRLGFRRDGHCLERAVFHPAILVGRPVFRPVPAASARAGHVRRRLAALSRRRPYATAWIDDGDDLRAERAGCD